MAISTKEFARAIVRTPCRRISDGLTSARMGTPDYDTALVQHLAYITALQDCGLEVIVLPADEQYPDSVFVEDTALLTSQCAIITNPGAASREGEIDLIRETIAGFYPATETIRPPGTVDAGDIMMVDNDFYIGLSERTNEEGATQMISLLRHYGMNGIMVQVEELLHLKSGLSYIEKNHLLISKAYRDERLFQSFTQLEVPDDETYAANSVWINEKVLVPLGFPKTKALIEAAGYETIVLDTSEFRKIDGGLSCLSLRF